MAGAAPPAALQQNIPEEGGNSAHDRNAADGRNDNRRSAAARDAALPRKVRCRRTRSHHARASLEKCG
eukprot:352281-Chlamydomonas_euryale.AAC.11